MEQVLTLSDEDLEVVLFYLTLISRGILFLHKHIGTNQHHLNFTHDSAIAYSVIFMEAFDSE